MPRTLAVLLLLLAVVLPPACAVDIFVYDGHFGTPGMRLTAPFLPLASGECWTADYFADAPPFRGTPEAGITGRLPGSINWPTHWIGPAGTGAWGYLSWAASYRHYNASGIADAQVADPWASSGGTWRGAVAPNGSLYIVRWDGTRPTGAKRFDVTAQQTWSGDLTAAGAGMRAACICADDNGFYCLFESADLARHAVVYYDLSTPSPVVSTPIDVTDAARAFAATGMALSTSTTPNSFIVCGDATGAHLGSNAVFVLAPSGLSLLQATVGESPLGLLQRDAYRNRVWVFGDGPFGYVDSSLAYHSAGMFAFRQPAEFVAQMEGLAAGGGKVAHADYLNRGATLWNADGTNPVVLTPAVTAGAQFGALSADGATGYVCDRSGFYAVDVATGNVTPLASPADFSIATRPLLGGGLLWAAGSSGGMDEASVLAVSATSGAEQKRWATDVNLEDLKDIAVSANGTRVALAHESNSPFTGAGIVLFDADGTELKRFSLPAFYELYAIAFAGNDQIVALVRLKQDTNAPAELVGYDLTGASLWRTVLPAGLPTNPYRGTSGGGVQVSGAQAGKVRAASGGVPGRYLDYPCLAADQTGNTLFVGDNLHGVIHRLVRQTQAAQITEVSPGASLRQRAVTVHVWGHGLPTSGSVVLRKFGAPDIPLTDVTFDGQAHLWGIANLSTAPGGWYDLLINAGGAPITYLNAMLVAADNPPATLMGTWRLNAWGPPGSLTTMYEDKLLMFLDEQGTYAWDRPGGSAAWAGKAAAFEDKLAMLNLDGLKRYRVGFSLNRDQLTLTQETGDGAPLVFQFSRRDEGTILGDEHVGAWKLKSYEGALPASATPTWNQTMAIYRDGTCRMESDRASGPWWRSGSLLLPGVTNGPAVFRTKAASTDAWAGQVWVGTWTWGATHQELVFHWLDEAGRTWSETWERTGSAPDAPVLALRLTGPTKITAGAAGTYTVTCENLGAVSAKNLTLRLTVPWLNHGNPIDLASIPELATGETRSVSYVVSCPADTVPGWYTFTAIADWTLPQVAQAKATLDVLVVPPQLDIALSESGPLVARPLEPFTWVLNLCNHGSDLSLVVPPTWDSQTAVYKDYDLPGGVAITGWPADGVHTGYSWALTWADLKRLIPHSGDCVALRFTLIADATAQPHTWAMNRVAVRPVDPAIPDVHPSDNADAVRTEIRTAWDPNAIYVTPVPIPGLAAGQTTPGGRLHYMVTFDNEGTEAANMVQVDVVLNPLLNLDTLSWATPEGLPAGATVDVTLDRDARRLRWVFRNLALAPGAEGQVQFAVNVDSAVDFAGADSLALSQAAKIYFDFAVEERAQMTEPPATVTVVKPVGDVNGDGVVNREDLRAFIAEWRRGRDPYMAHLEGRTLINADLNLNGKLDHQDAQMLIEKLRRQGDLP